MTDAPAPDRRHELGGFVRSLRARVQPGDIGLPTGARRRTPGLRREEVAQLAGLSVTWFTWLEQGRDISVSATMLSRLANALRLGRSERAYLFELAGKRDPDRGRSDLDDVPAAILDTVHAVAAPAYLLDRTWTARAWNDAAAALFAGWLDGDDAVHGRNLLRFIFLADPARTLIHDYDERARRVVAEFRADVSASLDDPDVRRLIDDLSRRSTDFARYWNERLVLGREGGARRFNHPRRGLLHYRQVSFTPAGRPDVKLTILTEAPEAAATSAAG